MKRLRTTKEYGYYVRESANDNDNVNIDGEVNAVLNDLVQKINSATRTAEKRTQNEASGALDMAGIVISAPFILHILGAGMRTAQHFFSKNQGDNKTIGEYVIKFADKMHHVLLKPLEMLAKTFTSNPKKQAAFAEVMMSGIVLFLLFMSGLSLVKYARKLKIGKSVLYAFKSGIKGMELKGMVSKLVQVAKDEMANVV